ncbi:hypothetical protein Pint_10187 [Pistacia integerrima]|uniref:Uncharacterized protein n=1 Tax=Pistacia integerrima TaxID=434235 RepID=A0ACC0XFQ5_9ROSI|nr:hypothetical protein Pint_10187 [Pistacia integerrima]
MYEGDGAKYGATLNFDHGTKWGFISAGNFLDYAETEEKNYIPSSKNKSLMRFPNLYSTARATPLFLTYYTYCLKNGNYTVNLHFAEILFRDEEPYNRVGRRIFDIYIQGQLKWKDFNVKEIANGTGKEIIRSFNTTVTDNILEIRLYWAGKGTTCIPVRGTYGPLISAISVCPGKLCNLLLVLITQLLFLLIVVCLSSWFMIYLSQNLKVFYLLWLELSLRYYFLFFVLWAFYVGDAIVNIKTQEKEILKGLDLQTGTFTYRQLKAATNNFDSANKIGEGGFGSVYKAFDLQQKGNLMDLVDENLANEFNKKEAERMIKVALLSCNATPSLRPTMTEVVSMLEEQTDIQDVISDPSIYNGDLQLKPLEDQSSTGSSTQKFSSDQTSLLRSTTSAHDLYSINSESIRGLTSAHDLYPLSSNTISLNQKDSSSISHHSS